MSSQNRIVVKIGSSLLASTDALNLRYGFMHGLMEDIARLQAAGNEVVLMSSGAVAMGMSTIGIKPGEGEILDKQAAAACGQPLLMNAYRHIAREFSMNIAQLLLTLDDMEDRERYLNTQNTLNRLFESESNIIPIINENDTVATAELCVGDNDRLAAKIAEMTGADDLVILTSIDGLYDRNPSEEGAEFIDRLEDVSSYLSVTEGTSALGSGGMKTKLQAANMAQQHGCTTYIAEGVIDQPITSVLSDSRRHTRCIARKNAASEWNSWLTNRLQVTGALTVRSSCSTRIENDLMPILLHDVVASHGNFSRGDVVHVFCEEGRELARGVSNFTAQEIDLMDRVPEDAVHEALGARTSPEVVSIKNIVRVEDHHLPWEAPAGAADQAA